MTICTVYFVGWLFICFSGCLTLQFIDIYKVAAVVNSVMCVVWGLCLSLNLSVFSKLLFAPISYWEWYRCPVDGPWFFLGSELCYMSSLITTLVHNLNNTAFITDHHSIIVPNKTRTKIKHDNVDILLSCFSLVEEKVKKSH